MLNSIKLILLVFLVSCAAEPKVIEKKPKQTVVPMDEKIYQQIINKKHQHPFVITGFEDAAEFRDLQKNDIENLRKEIDDAKLKYQISFDENFKNKLRKNLTQQLEYIDDFNSKLTHLQTSNDEKTNNSLNPHYILPQVRYNKLNLFLDEVVTFSDEKLGQIINGKILSEIYKGSYLLPAHDIMQDQNPDIKADLTIPVTISTMLAILKTINEENYQQYFKNNLNSSSLFYWYKTPRGLDIDHNSIFFASYKDMGGMILVHNGYSFGGSVYGNSRPKFTSTPHDCSSYISHIIGLGKDPFTKEKYVIWTSDGYNFNNFVNESYFSYADLKRNITSYGLLAQKMEVVPLTDISSFEDGDILLFRNFAHDQKKTDSLGSGGHTGIVLGTDKEDKIYLLNYIRNYENLETGGFLMSAISLSAIQDESKAAVLFRYKGYEDPEKKVEDIIDVKITDKVCELTYRDKTMKCDFGKNGASLNKVEGDGKTPIGTFNLREVFYRKDKVGEIKTQLPISKIEENYGWCDDAKSVNYNKFTYLPAKNCNSAESLYRTIDNAYDIIVPFGYNDQKIVKGRGSAIFLHAFKPNNEPTQGCIAVDKNDLLEILKDATEETKIRISSY